MKIKIQTGLAAMLLFIALSCSKDSANTSGNSNNRISSSQTSYAVTSSNDEEKSISIVGKWILNYDWDCNGYPLTVVTTFNADGTWINSNGYSGLWITGKHILTFIYNNSETTYSGITGVKQIHGIQSTFKYAGSRSGCFNMEPYTDSFKKQVDGKTDDSGKSK